MESKLISVVTPCFNEEGNIHELILRIRAVFQKLNHSHYEHIFIDNDSKDRTRDILRMYAEQDKKIKLIFNTRNFGHIRSPFYGLLQATGDAVIIMASDLQDPPELIEKFLEKWNEGIPVVLGVKDSSQESPIMFLIRKAYYSLIYSLADTQIVKNSTGFGLFDRKVIQILQKIHDPYPYFRGLISELGFPLATISFNQPTRKRGITSNNFYKLYDMAMLGITSHSKVPLRLATILGFFCSFLGLLITLTYTLLKLIYWDSFQMGLAPLLVGAFFFMSIQLFFIGIIGEYIGFIHTQVLKRPLVIEKERINF
ncbi:MAG: glycosyltransferase family 2 protein [Bdellovibrionia bacterium]